MAHAFAGPLSRFYARDPDEALALRRGVEAWRDDLRASVAAKVAARLTWDEGADVAFRAELDEAGWMGLRLFALYAERAEAEMPDTLPPLLELDPQWRAAAEAKFARSLYGQILACRVWLPGDFPVTLRAPLPDGDAAEIGSLDVLADQLRWLNQRTFQADIDALAGWRELPALAGGGLLDAARRGLAALAAAVAIAQRFVVPVVVVEA